jgi:hypothetical protein
MSSKFLRYTSNLSRYAYIANQIIFDLHKAPYKTAVDEITSSILKDNPAEKAHNQSEKNIHRRVYDIMQVMKETGILFKDGKSLVCRKSRPLQPHPTNERKLRRR